MPDQISHICGETALSLGAASVAAELDELGALSGVAQELNGPITTCEKLAASFASANAAQQHHLLLYRDESGRAVGFIKWGVKSNLYFYRKNGSMLQCSPVCLLDFFVHESQQRRGVGLLMFKAMLLDLGGPEPCSLAYDRPSPKLLAFMRKHYGLAQPDLQPNRFALFEGFFTC